MQQNKRGNSVIGGLYGGDARGVYGGSGNRYLRGNNMIYGKPKKRWPKFLLAIVIILIIIACIWQFACGGLPFLQAQPQEQQQEQPAEQADQQQQQVATQGTTDESLNGVYTEGLNATIKISAVGDCTLGADSNFDDDTSFTKKFADKGVSYFFKRVKQFFGSDDLTIANFEGVLTASNERADKEYAFKGPTSYTKILTDGGVDAVNLANDHSFDYGKGGYEDTKTALEKSKIESFGYDRTTTSEINGVKVGFYGIDTLESMEDATKLMKQDVAALQKEECALIIGYFTWGEEGKYETSTGQVKLAHAAVDAGTDLVLGSHTHVLQGIEEYNGRYIAYSLGNFCYGGNSDPSDYNTMIFQQTFTITNGQLEISEETRKDASVIPCKVSSSPKVNDYQPLPSSGAEATSALKKINEYCADLSGDSATFETTLDASGVAPVK